jgi:phosphoribosyl 1,2-cyclic phosphate phosphodiesterase
MSELIVTFLGTGTSQGIPVITCTCEVCSSLDYRDKRLRTSIFIEVNGRKLCIDTGPDFRQQMLREHVGDLDAVIFTHEHKDHTAGLDDVRAFNYLQNKNIPVYGTENVHVALKREFAYAFTEHKYPGIPLIDLHLIDNKPFELFGITITPIQVMHYKLPVLGFRIGDFTYITDANYIAPEEMEKIKGSKVLVLNALQKEEHISHYTLQEALDVIKELNPEKAYLTHLSHRMGKHADVDKELPGNVYIAFDGLRLNIK